jgi:hypothetical protein
MSEELTPMRKKFSFLLYVLYTVECTEPVFLNVYGAQESIPRNEFRQPV